MIIGTAGHIDHGKTALVKALTGVDADRLAEEKKRGITIDLGYAYAPLPDGTIAGFVDVPGHERFVHNMLAGATGVDLVLLVVAANDGIMPQTVRRAVQESLRTILRGREVESSVIRETGGDFNLTELLRELEQEMQEASANLEFERAALLRDQIMEVKSGTGLTKIEPKRRPVKYSRSARRRRSRV